MMQEKLLKLKHAVDGETGARQGKAGKGEKVRAAGWEAEVQTGSERTGGGVRQVLC